MIKYICMFVITPKHLYEFGRKYILISSLYVKYTLTTFFPRKNTVPVGQRVKPQGAASNI